MSAFNNWYAFQGCRLGGEHRENLRACWDAATAAAFATVGAEQRREEMLSDALTEAAEEVETLRLVAISSGGTV